MSLKISQYRFKAFQNKIKIIILIYLIDAFKFWQNLAN